MRNKIMKVRRLLACLLLRFKRCVKDGWVGMGGTGSQWVGCIAWVIDIFY